MKRWAFQCRFFDGKEDRRKLITDSNIRRMDAPDEDSIQGAKELAAIYFECDPEDVEVLGWHPMGDVKVYRPDLHRAEVAGVKIEKKTLRKLISGQMSWHLANERYEAASAMETLLKTILDPDRIEVDTVSPFSNWEIVAGG